MVLAGARRLMERHRPAVFVEIHEPSLVRLGSSRRELIDTLVGLNYSGHMLRRSGIGPPERPEDLIARSSQGYIDVLFLPQSSPHRRVSGTCAEVASNVSVPPNLLGTRRHPPDA